MPRFLFLFLYYKQKLTLHAPLIKVIGNLSESVQRTKYVPNPLHDQSLQYVCPKLDIWGCVGLMPFALKNCILCSAMTMPCEPG